MRLLVCGARDWGDRLLFSIVMRGFLDKYPNLEIVEGCARGADHMAEQFALQFGLECHHFPADWDACDSNVKWRAGHDRNKRMLKEGKPEMVVAFKNVLHPKLAKGGTENMIKQAKIAGVPVMVVGGGPKIG